MDFICNTKNRTLFINQTLVVYEPRVLAVVQIMWEKPNERYINDLLNRHGVIKTAL